MVAIIDDEFINGIKMCNQVEFLFEDKLISCTFNLISRINGLNFM